MTTGLSVLSASVGLAIFPEDGEGPGDVMDVADAEAMDAKRERRDRAAAARRAA